MKPKSIVIHKPKVYSQNGKCRLSARIEWKGVNDELYFEFEEKYAKYACPERSDAFLLMMLIPALYEGFDIVCEQPITEQLLYQLESIQIPFMTDLISEYHKIRIVGTTSTEVDALTEGCGVAFSAGVDSFYTTIKHLDARYSSYQMTHLVFNNVGALTKDHQKAKEIFEEKSDYFSKVANELNVSLVAINTNILEMIQDYDEVITSPDTFKNAACVYALKKMFRIFLWSSNGEDLNRFKVTFDVMGNYDIVNCQNLSLMNFRMQFFDATTTRMEKVAYIADNEIVQRYLNVCEGENDSKCFKCTRTMFELYALKKLEKFGEVFDVEWFMANLADRIAYSLGDKNEWRYGYCQETLFEAKQNGVSIPTMAWVLAVLKYRPLLFMKRRFKGNRTIRKLYEKFDLRRKLNFQG